MRRSSNLIEVGRVHHGVVFAACDPKRVTHYFVEQENFTGPSVDAVRASSVLAHWQFCTGGVFRVDISRSIYLTCASRLGLRRWSPHSASDPRTPTTRRRWNKVSLTASRNLIAGNMPAFPASSWSRTRRRALAAWACCSPYERPLTTRRSRSSSQAKGDSATSGFIRS